MQSAANSIPLTRRLVGQYLVFGLACLLFCISASLALSYQAQLDTYVGFVLLGTCTLLVIGAATVFFTSRHSSYIEGQLLQLQASPVATSTALKKLSGNDATIAGWNRLVETVEERDMWQAIETQLANAQGDSQVSQAELIFNNLPWGVVVTTLDEQIESLNPAFATTIGGKELTALEGLSITDVLKLEEAFNAEEIFNELDGYRGALTFDLRREKKVEGGVLRITRCPATSADGSHSHHIWLARDITQQVLAEESRAQFISTATHELRTPLSNIRSYAEMLDIEGGVSVDKQKEFCNIINAEATRLLRFVDELLSINQMEVGSMTIHQHQTDLEAVVKSVLENVRPDCNKKKITLTDEFPAKWPRMNLDKDKIESALVNLVGNAAKYTPDGGRVVVEVDVSETDVKIHVEDNGIGISAEELPHIFDKFYRSADERVHEVSGNGLGLSFTSEVARLHGGKLTVHSELNKGSRFTLTLPIG